MGREVTYIDFVKRLPATDEGYVTAQCPVCGSVGLTFQYFGFADSKFGWKLVWCNVCSKGIRISRTKIPPSANVLIKEDEQKRFLEQHANICLID